jgi:hypothetical protein
LYFITELIIFIIIIDRTKANKYGIIINRLIASGCSIDGIPSGEISIWGFT